MARFPKNLIRRAKGIRFLLLDVDGVMTDGRIYLDGEGRETKAFHILDGAGIRLAVAAGISVGLLSGRRSSVIEARARELGLQEVHHGISDKLAVFEDIIKRHAITDSEVAYMGDDLIDLPIFARVGLAVAVPNAHESVIKAAHWITSRSGGLGAVRDVTDLLIACRKASRNRAPAPRRNRPKR